MNILFSVIFLVVTSMLLQGAWLMVQDREREHEKRQEERAKK
jgi:hypothetical protein|tara:strand:+ start:398 stop:523 length:126 start_codon:yes stop_codon:yes gene_type:complete